MIRTLLFLVYILSCTSLTFLNAQSWNKELPGLGTFSSPRISDLNGDGIGDIIVGAGREEFISCDSAILALDGRNGQILWKVSARDQIFGSAALYDINLDGIKDVVINGRSAELKAINGQDGSLIWEFFETDDPKVATSKGWFNFYNPQFIPDQNGDGLEDILISNGGDVMVEAYDPNRPAGSLLVINTADGTVLAKANMPDDKEIYMSVAAITSGKEVKVIFGTGGETIGGNLFVTTLKDIMNEDLSGSQKLASSPEKGFISPPAWVDITDDGQHDIIALAVDGRIFAFDGKTHEPIWERLLPDTEIYSSLAVGYFTSDGIPDFFVSVAQGEWPKLEWNRQFMVDGQSGEIAYQDSLGFYQTSTAVVGDFSGDGRDEVLLSVNYQELNEFYQKFFFNMLVAIKFDTGEVIPIGKPFNGNNISSTPWMGDLDNNGNLDIIYCHGTNTRQTYVFDGMKVMRLSTDIPVYGEIKWGSYMGSQYNGVWNK